MRDLQLDLDVATRLAGYRWVEWRHALLRGAPIDEPGRFLAPPDDPLAHLREAADPEVPPQESALAALPAFSEDLELATGVAGRVGLFREGGATLRRTPDRRWVLDVPASGRHYEGPAAAPLVCRAALDWSARATARGGSTG